MEGVIAKSDAGEQLRRQAVDESILEVDSPGIDKQTLEHWETERVRSEEEEIDHARAVAGPEAEILTDGGSDESNAHGQAILDRQLDEAGSDDEPVLHVGDHVMVEGREATTVVIRASGTLAGDYYVEKIDETVAEYNDCDPDEPVYQVVFADRTDKDLADCQRYPYPRSMLTLESPLHGRDADEDEGGDE